jgi:DNA primase catalytic subunit
MKRTALVIDVDIKAFDRPCDCGPHSLCDVCWVQCARVALVDLIGFFTDFIQFRRVCGLFSGRAGFHVIVNDERAWNMDQEARNALLQHLPKTVKVDAGAAAISHMIKIPFSPHASTGNVAMPIENPQTFLPSRDAIHYSRMTGERMEQLKQFWRDVIIS